MFRKKGLALVLFLGIGIGIYFSFAKLLYRPTEIKYFSLIDDGQEIENTFAINSCITGKGCRLAKEVFVESKFGRLRPIYWIVQWANINILGLDAILQHSARVFALGGLIVLLWFYLTTKLKINKFVSLIFLICFVSSNTFSENILRLGPIEPYLLLALAISSSLYLSMSNYLLIGLILLISTLLKESGIASFLAFLIAPNYRNHQNKKTWLLLLFFISVSILFIYRNNFVNKESPLAYGSNYGLNINKILSNSIGYISTVYEQNKELSIFGTISVLMMCFEKKRRKFRLVKIYWLFLLILVNFIVLIPWTFVLSRYVLPLLFFIYLLFAFAINYWWKYVIESITSEQMRFVANILLVILLSNVLASGFLKSLATIINYRNWLASYVKYENDYVSSIYNYLKITNRTSLFTLADSRLDNWEVQYEIPLHLKYFYNFKVNLSNDLKLVQAGDILLENSSLHSINKFDIEKWKLLEERNYSINQIDHNLFIQEIRKNPSLFKDEKWSYKTLDMWTWKIWVRKI